jgi:hypothetical protein
VIQLTLPDPQNHHNKVGCWTNRGFNQLADQHCELRGNTTMTADALDQEFGSAPMDGVLADRKSTLASVFTFAAYVGVFVGYMTIFLVSLLTVGFLEIRQANMSDFNALIATLEQRDRYADNHLDQTADNVRAELDAYRKWVASPVCFDIAGTPAAAENGAAARSGLDGAGGDPKTCSELKQALELHANQLSLTEDEVRFKSANLPLYYDQYQDGITRKTPQIIPALWLLDSKYRLLTLWARSPFELIEMFLLVCMGLLGGVISVMRYFVDPSLKNPAIGEFFYKPAAGAAISLGVYVLFRAAQIFLGMQTQDGASTMSTSIFLLAGLGLASGYCASEALAQIESVASRLLRTPTQNGPDRQTVRQAT